MRTVPEFPPPLRAVAALALFLLAFCLTVAVAVAQDSAAVAAPASPASSLVAMVWLAVPLAVYVVMKALKWLSPRLAALPPVPQRLAVLAVSALLTMAGSAAGVPLPTTVDALTQSDVTTLLTWLATILVGGGGAMAVHATTTPSTKE